MNSHKAALRIGALVALIAPSARPQDYRVKNWNLHVSVIPKKTTFKVGEPVFV